MKYLVGWWKNGRAKLYEGPYFAAPNFHSLFQFILSLNNWMKISLFVDIVKWMLWWNRKSFNNRILTSINMNDFYQERRGSSIYFSLLENDLMATSSFLMRIVMKGRIIPPMKQIYLHKNSVSFKFPEHYGKK